MMYRCVETDPPTLWDFTSDEERGGQLRPPITEDRQRYFEGVSMYNDLERAAWRARRLPLRADWIAVMELPEVGLVHYEKTFSDPHHFTVWGTPQALLNCVRCVLQASL